MRRLAFLALFLAGCSGSPTAPSVSVVSTPAPVAVVARDGITGETVTASVQQSGGMVTVTAPGFLARSQPTAATIYLWGQSDAYVRALVYADTATGVARPLVRWKRGGVRVAFAAGLERHDVLLQEHVEELNRVTRNSFQASPAGSPAEIVLRVDSSRVPSTAIAVTSRSIDATYGITSAAIYFDSDRTVTDRRDNVLMHELGHAIGLQHSFVRHDVMDPDTTPNRTFTDAESRSITMAYSWRKAGNTFPDSEPQGLASSRPETYTISCH